MSTKRQLLISNILLFLIPLVIITGLFYYKLVNTLWDSTAEYAAVLIDQCENNLNGLIEEAETTAQMLTHEITLQQALRQRPELSSFDSYRIRMNRWLKNIHKYSAKRLDAFYVMGEYQILSTNDADVNLHDVKESDWYNAAINEDGPIWYGSHEGSFVGVGNGNKISMLTTVHDTLDDTLRGVILIDINEDEFKQIVSIGLDEISSVKVLDVDGTSVLFNIEDDCENNNNGRSSFLSREIILYEKVLENGWTIQMEIPVARLAMQKAISIMAVVAVIVVIMIAIAMMVSFNISNKISDPIIRLKNAFLQMEEGNLDVSVSENKGSSELRSLSSSFNHMVGRVKSLVDREISSQQRLRESELKALTAQINPHFLYNTLDTIAWNIRLNNNQSAIEALYALTQLFRISISKGNQVISLEKEFEHVEMYLKLQTLRYSDILSFEIDLPDNLKKYQITKIVLQPLVENSIYHGIKENDREGTVIVSATEQGDDILLTVSDDGVGIESDKLESLNKMLSDNVSYHKEVFGVLNVNLRIKMKYGEQYGITYESKLGEYTKAMILIPKIESAAEPDKER